MSPFFLSTLAKIVYFYPNIPTLVCLAKREGKISKNVTNIHFIIVYISSPHCPAVYTAVTLLKNDWLKCKFEYHPTTSKSTYQKKKKCNSTINDNVEIQLVLIVQDLVRGKGLPTQILFLCTLREFDNEFLEAFSLHTNGGIREKSQRLKNVMQESRVPTFCDLQNELKLCDLSHWTSPSIFIARFDIVHPISIVNSDKCSNDQIFKCSNF